MSDMFENFDNQSIYYVPNNRHFPIGIDETDTIIRGGTCYHVFEIPYKWSDAIKTEQDVIGIEFKNRITYTNKLKVVLEKLQAKGDFEIIEEEKRTFIRIKLTPAETLLFEKGWDTFSQIQLQLLNKDIIFTRKCKIKVIDTLRNKNKKGDN